MSATIETPFSIGVMADCQYADLEDAGARKYIQSKEKLQKCVEHFNSMNLAFTIHLGDLIDRDWKNFDVVQPIFNSLKMPTYQVLGNHDFWVEDDEKAAVFRKLEMPFPYYDFKVANWRFIVLDGNDLSFHAFPEISEGYQITADYYMRNQIDAPYWNGAIGPTQLQWLRTVLDQAEKDQENVMVFCHFPVYPEDIHNLWNAEEVITILENYPNVKAYLNGHNHKGNYGVKNGIHYLNIHGMVDTETNAYAVLEFYHEHIKVIGYGREENRFLNLQ